jgi:hypothetical protein
MTLFIKAIGVVVLVLLLGAGAVEGRLEAVLIAGSTGLGICAFLWAIAWVIDGFTQK